MLGHTESLKEPVESSAERAYREFYEANEDLITPEESEYWLEVHRRSFDDNEKLKPRRVPGRRSRKKKSEGTQIS